MTDYIINNPVSLRSCILYEFTKLNEPFKIYKKLMKRLDDDFMTYPEFEFWYMRFAQGNFDLNYDFSLEPKKRQITDLPVEIFENIGDYLHFIDRVNLRLVSKDIQFRVDNWNPKITEFTYHSFNWWSIEQNSKTYDFIQSHYSYKKPPKQLPAVVRILKNPKLRLQKLTVDHDSKWKTIEEELRKSSTKLHVNNLTLKSPKSPIDLSLFAPKSLEEITIVTNETSVEKMNEIVNPEQCKQLKMITIRTKLDPSEFPFESFIGYPRFTIEILPNRSAETVAEFIKKLVKCTQLELCKLECVSSSWKSVKEYFSEENIVVPDSPNIRRYPIQGSTDYYQVNFGRTISIERKT